MAKITPRIERLLAALRVLETEGRALPERDFNARVASEAGYKEIKTYRSKYLDGRITFPRGDGSVEVHGSLAISLDEFAELLSQNKKSAPSPLRYDTEGEWQATMHTLATLGANRGYRVDAEDRELFRELIGS